VKIGYFVSGFLEQYTNLLRVSAQNVVWQPRTCSITYKNRECTTPS
jgi:hypothetical protein